VKQYQVKIAIGCKNETYPKITNGSIKLSLS